MPTYYKEPFHGILLASIISKLAQHPDNRSLAVQISVSKSKSRPPKSQHTKLNNTRPQRIHGTDHREYMVQTTDNKNVI